MPITRDKKAELKSQLRDFLPGFSVTQLVAKVFHVGMGGKRYFQSLDLIQRPIQCHSHH